MLWVKICGMTTPEDALAAAEAGADAIGMLFAPSKRRVNIKQATEIAKALPKTLEKVGVFYDESAGAIEEIAAEVGLTAVQLHGDESPEFAKALFRTAGRCGRKARVLKTLHISDEVERLAREYIEDGGVDGLLLDSMVRDEVTGFVERGGTGQVFDWKRGQPLVSRLGRSTRVVVAGGLSPTNVGEAIRVLRPWGVDVCSGVEMEPGKKDVSKVRDFIAIARESAEQFATRGSY